MFTVFQINVVANSGSTGHVTEGIAEAVMNEGWSCFTAYGRWANTSKTHLYRIGNKYNVYLHYLKSRLLDMHGLGSQQATKCLIEKIKEVNPDLIHLHNIHGYYVNYPLLFEFLSVNYERYRRVAPVWWLGLLLPVMCDSDRILEFAKVIAWL